MFLLRLLLILDSRSPETISRVHTVPWLLVEWKLFGSTENPIAM
jgi:hypothetical protein